MPEIQISEVPCVLFLGLDGAEWDVINPLLERGCLPTIARLIDEGTSGTMQSLDVLRTPSIWTSIAAGKFPVNHGVNNFFDTAADVKTKRLWDILEGVYPDMRFGLFHWPVTWPPRQIHGYMIPSFLAHSVETFPPEYSFVKEMESRVKMGQLSFSAKVEYFLRLQRYIKWKTSLAILWEVATGRFRPVLERHFRERHLQARIQMDLCLHLVDRFRPSFTTFYSLHTDSLSHMFWRYYQPERFPPINQHEVDLYANVIPHTYQMVDRFLGRILGRFDDQTLVVLLSDHGFKPASSSGQLYLLETPKLLALLDLVHVVDYINIGSAFACLQARQTHQEDLAKVEDILRCIYLPTEGHPLFQVTRSSMGDIILEPPAFEQDPEVIKEMPIRLTPDLTCRFSDLFRVNDWHRSGDHDKEAVLILRGPNVKRGHTLTAASVVDVAPTVLALLDLPVGEDMDGHVLVDAIDEAFLAAHPIRTIPTYDDDDAAWRVEKVDEEEPSPLVMQRLRSLGYID